MWKDDRRPLRWVSEAHRPSADPKVSPHQYGRLLDLFFLASLLGLLSRGLHFCFRRSCFFSPLLDHVFVLLERLLHLGKACARRISLHARLAQLDLHFLDHCLLSIDYIFVVAPCGLKVSDLRFQLLLLLLKYFLLLLLGHTLLILLFLGNFLPVLSDLGFLLGQTLLERVCVLLQELFEFHYLTFLGNNWW